MKRLHRIHQSPAIHWVGNGFPVRSVFNYNGLGRELSPFLLLDYAAPYVFSPGNEKRGVKAHPHKGFETVTVVYQGELEHCDSSGSGGLIGPGDVQWTTYRALLAEDDIHPPKPDTLSDEALSKRMWELIHALARRRVFLDHTDHLSDRELYTLLVERMLDEETEAMPPEAGWNCQFTLYEYGRAGMETGEMTYLRYYADEETREEWAADFEDEMPPHEDPPYNRDRRLPRADE